MGALGERNGMETAAMRYCDTPPMDRTQALLFHPTLDAMIPATFYEKGAVSRRNLRSLVPGHRKRFNLLSAAQQTEHGFGSRSGIFSGSWVNGPNGRVMLAGLYPLHDAGTSFSFRCRFSLNNAVAVSLP